jgi:hypothetical protein
MSAARTGGVGAVIFLAGPEPSDGIGLISEGLGH